MLPILLFIHIDVYLDDVCELSISDEEALRILGILIGFAYEDDLDVVTDLLNINPTNFVSQL